MLTAIVLPADDSRPIRQQELAVSDLDGYRQLVGGNLEMVSLDRPPASLYVNEEGKLHDLPVNLRATLLAWVHNPALLRRDLIHGDGFIVGPVDEHGDDTTAPAELVDLLLGTPRYKVEVQADSSGTWSGNELTWTDWFQAYFYAVDLAQRWSSVREVRVVGV